MPNHNSHVTIGHQTTVRNFSVVGREDQNLIRTIIRVTNKNIGNLSKMWDKALLKDS